MNNKEYAGFWIRFGAALIDTIIVTIVLRIPLTLIYGQEYWQKYSHGDEIFIGFWDILLDLVVPICGTIWFWLKYSATPGKMATKLKVVDAVSGEKIRLGQAIGRYLSYIPAGLPLGLGFIWIGVDKKKQGWHDKLAGTVVIRDTGGPEPVNFEKNV